jgi:hypothetical protein
MKKAWSLHVSTAGMLLWICGCAHTPETPPPEVRFVTEREQVAGCVPLGRVTGSSSFGGISAQQLGKERAEEEMRGKAGRLGADVVLVQSSQGGFFGAESVGDAYRCLGRAPAAAAAVTAPQSVPAASPVPPAPPAPAPRAGGCEKDTDCKGDRICESGKCVKP